MPRLLPVAALLILAGSLPAGTNPLPFKIGRVQARVEVHRPRGVWTLAIPGRELPPGSSLRTAPGSRAEILLESLNPITLCLGASTEVQVVEDPVEADLSLVRGALELVRGEPGPAIRVWIGAAVLTTGGSAALEAEPGPIGLPRGRLSALTGPAEARIPRGVVRRIAEGSTLALPPGGPSLWRVTPLTAIARLDLLRRLRF